MSDSVNHAVFFDLDGTLLDTAPDLAAAVNELRADAGRAPLPLAQLAPLCSFGARGLLEEGLGLMPDSDGYRETYRDFIERYRARMTQDTRPFEGMRGVIRQIADSGWHWGVITNKLESLALPIMRAMAFDPPPACVVGGDSAARAKPDPAPMFLACERAGLDAAGCIYVGDSSRDIEAGRAAGMQTIGVSFGYIPPDDDIQTWNATIVVETVAQLGPAIADLQARLQKGGPTRQQA